MKKFTKVLVSCSAILILLVIIFNLNGTAKKIPDIEPLRHQIEVFLNDRSSLIISDANIMDTKTFKDSISHSKENNLRASISKYRNELETKGETYSSIRTEIELEEPDVITDKLIYMKGRESTFMKRSNNGSETGYSAKHEFIFEEDTDGEWVIVQDRQLEPTGLLPLHEAEKYVYP